MPPKKMSLTPADVEDLVRDHKRGGEDWAADVYQAYWRREGQAPT